MAQKKKHSVSPRSVSGRRLKGPSPLEQVEELIAEYGGLAFNDVAAAQGLKERALVLVRYLSQGDTRLYGVVDKSVVDLLPCTQPWVIPAAKELWATRVSTVVNVLRALREVVLLEQGPNRRAQGAFGFEPFLHPLVVEHSLEHYRDGDYRDAVVNAMLALADLMRARSGSKLDGAPLANEVLSPAMPILEFSPRGSRSEVDDHKGFHKIVLGAFEGIRNPKTHSLAHDLDAVKAAQYLVFISLLIRRVSEATYVGGQATSGDEQLKSGLSETIVSAEA